MLAELLQDQNIYISFITEIELYAYHGNNDASIQILKEFIRSVMVINMSDEIKNSTILCRRDHKLKIPDAIIASSASVWSLTLITADKAFKKVSDIDLLIYDFS